jgi:hypothetical protein
MINSRQLIEDWSRATKEEWLQRFSKQIGMTEQSLMALNCCWASPHSAWAFPMRDSNFKMVGIRLRSESGAKWSVRGSHQGIFTPPRIDAKEILVLEGATDTAAALTLGYVGVGRPSCSGGILEIKTLVTRLGIRRVVIVCDNDKPGIDGAIGLQRHLTVPSCLVTLPCKDLRAYLSLGGTKALLDSMINSCVWTK